MAAGAPDSQPLSAGLSAQQLVSPIQGGMVTPDAVSQLVDAYRKGAIGMADIQDRIGAEAMAQKRAHIQQLQEYVSPQAIQSRMAQIGAQGAQAELQTQTAQAQSGLVEPLTELIRTQTARQQAEAESGQIGLPAFDSLHSRYGLNPSDYTTKDGRPDFSARVAKGNELALNEANINAWFGQLTPEKVEDVTDANGQTLQVSYNKFGKVVSPPNPQLGYKGSDGYWFLVHQLNNLMPDSHPLRRVLPVEDHPIQDNEKFHGGDGPVINSPGASTPLQVTPKNEQAIRADYQRYLIGQGADEDAALKMASKADPETIKAFANSQLPTPSVEPISQPATAAASLPEPTLTGGAGPVTKFAQTPFERRKEILNARSELRKMPDVDEYYKALPTYTKFADSARRAPVANNGPTDLGLAENYSKMHDPTSTIREFKFDALRQVIPLLEKFADFKGQIDREHIFPPQVRQALIEDGMRTVDAAEGALRPTFDAAEKTLPGTLDTEQQQILKGVPFSQRRGHVYAPAGATGGTASGYQTLKSGKRVMFESSAPVQ